MPDNRKPLKHGAFPVCRNYTVRAYLRHPCPDQRGGCKDLVYDSGTHQRILYSGYLHPHDYRYAPESGKRGGRIPGRNYVRRAPWQDEERTAPVPSASGRTVGGRAVWSPGMMITACQKPKMCWAKPKRNVWKS